MTDGDGVTTKKQRKAERRAEKARRKAEKKAWKKARPRGMPWVTPLLWVADVRAEAHFCEKAFGFELKALVDGPDGKAIHAELSHRRGLVMLGPAPAEAGTPRALKGATATTYTYVADVDEIVARAAAAGAKIVTPARDEHWGDRCATVSSPEGHLWTFATHLGSCGDETSGQETVSASAATAPGLQERKSL
jgi:uncharacterized glyoxalase superfamily protein PhnB